MLSERLMAFQQGILRMCESQFPRCCGTCGRIFSSFKDYVVGMSPVNSPMPDREDDDPIGLMSFANCTCGSTLALRCEDTSGDAHRRFNEAVRLEMRETGRREREILIELRDVLRAAASSLQSPE
jgi:hypothetical protein